MLYRIFISLFICLQTVSAYSQDSLPYRTKLHLGASVGVNATLRPFFKGEAADPLIAFDNHTIALQYLSISYFFRKHWGVALNVRMSYPKRAGIKSDQFSLLMHAQYDKDYYVYPDANGASIDHPGFAGEMEDGSLGIVYRLEGSRFFIYPKLAIGLITINGNIGSVRLKQKNANDEFYVSFMQNGGTTSFTMAASALAGYKLSKRIFVHIEPLGTFYKTRFYYDKSITISNTHESTTAVIPYKRNVVSVSLSAGFSYVLY